MMVTMVGHFVAMVGYGFSSCRYVVAVIPAQRKYLKSVCLRSLRIRSVPTTPNSPLLAVESWVPIHSAMVSTSKVRLLFVSHSDSLALTIRFVFKSSEKGVSYLGQAPWEGLELSLR